jgi:uncharacterized protein
VPASAHRQLTPVPYTQVTFSDPFWAPRLETNRAVSIPHMYQELEDTGRISAFDLKFTRAVPSSVLLIFGDSDAAKWIEAASYTLKTHPDPALQTLVNQVADRIIAAQQPDGYLNTHFIVAQPDMRWKNLRDWHEMYCAGHLIEGAIAHYEATSDPKLLDALRRYADHIDAAFGPEPGQQRGYCGHPEIEMALVRLYHATNEPRFLKLAHYFIEERGQQPHYYDIEARKRGDDPAAFRFKNYEYCQAHLPVREQTDVVGHAVRAMYLYSAITDLAHETNDITLLQTVERLWDNLCNRRLYITGGLGPSGHNEGFTTDYDLPDETAYAETCAAIALIQWNHRLLQVNGDGKYADLIERALYNGFISGVSLDGKSFFYENPLASNGSHHRAHWFDCPCCPPNLGRLLASLGQYMYSTGANDAWVHLYAQSTANLTIAGQAVTLEQITQYPWSGDIQLKFNTETPITFDLHLRIPGWCSQWQVAVNGQPVDNLITLVDGYLAISREWTSGDSVTLSLQMPVQSVWAHPAVRQMQGRLALQRGPVVYCLEAVDHLGLNLDRISIDPDSLSQFETEYHPDLLGGVTTLTGTALITDDADWGDMLYRQNKQPALKPVAFTAIPYCTWDNRAPGQMRVWFQKAG